MLQRYSDLPLVTPGSLRQPLAPPPPPPWTPAPRRRTPRGRPGNAGCSVQRSSTSARRRRRRAPPRPAACGLPCSPAAAPITRATSAARAPARARPANRARTAAPDPPGRIGALSAVSRARRPSGSLGGGERHARFRQERVDRKETRGRERGGVALDQHEAMAPARRAGTGGAAARWPPAGFQSVRLRARAAKAYSAARRRRAARKSAGIGPATP